MSANEVKNWSDGFARNTYGITKARLGYPSFVNPYPGGYAIWNKDKLRSYCFDEVLVKDIANGFVRLGKYIPAQYLNRLIKPGLFSTKKIDNYNFGAYNGEIGYKDGLFFVSGPSIDYCYVVMGLAIPLISVGLSGTIYSDALWNSIKAEFWNPITWTVRPERVPEFYNRMCSVLSMK